MIIPSIVFLALATLAEVPKEFHKLRVEIDQTRCLAYDRWKADLYEYKRLVMEDKVEYLSWYDFVKLQEAFKISELENVCNSVLKEDRK